MVIINEVSMPKKGGKHRLRSPSFIAAIWLEASKGRTHAQHIIQQKEGSWSRLPQQ